MKVFDCLRKIALQSCDIHGGNAEATSLQCSYVGLILALGQDCRVISVSISSCPTLCVMCEEVSTVCLGAPARLRVGEDGSIRRLVGTDDLAVCSIFLLSM